MQSHLSFSKPPLQTVDCPLLQAHDIVLNVLRLDLIHPLVHGNKWFKLKYNLAFFREQEQLHGPKPVLSFGGAYSNHLQALAAAGRAFGIPTIGLVRGELVEPLNPLLRFAADQGMQLHAISRSDYRRKHEPAFQEQLIDRFGDFHLLPEGGSNLLALRGCEEIASHLAWERADAPHIVALAGGTGTTAAGVISGIGRQCEVDESNAVPEVLVIAVLKAQGYLSAEIERCLGWLSEPVKTPAWSVSDDFHGGGYAKCPPLLRTFIEEFASLSAIPIEPVYTAKLFFGLFEMIKSGEIRPGSELIALHTGGVDFLYITKNSHKKQRFIG